MTTSHTNSNPIIQSSRTDCYSALSSLVVGFIFGCGLIVSAMINPAKVVGFLQVFSGSWDPSLGLVMAGAIAVGVVGFGVSKKRQQSLLGCAMQLPTSKVIDRKLIIGNVLFGIGWGIAGFCPGPALVGVVLGFMPAVVFVLAMLAGMWLFSRTQ